ncbi:hypothetical protein E2320_003580, partial [Naja naja]
MVSMANYHFNELSFHQHPSQEYFGNPEIFIVLRFPFITPWSQMSPPNILGLSNCFNILGGDGLGSLPLIIGMEIIFCRPWSLSFPSMEFAL